MTSTKTALTRVSRRNATVIVAGLVALSGCSDDGAQTTPTTDGGAGLSSTGGAPNAGASNGGAPNAGGRSGGAGVAGAGGSAGSSGGGVGGGSGGATGGANTGGAPTGGAGGSGTGGGGNGGAGGTGGGATCKNPVFVTSDPNGGWSDGGYYVHNNMWNSSAGLGPETLSACSYHSWYVVSNQTNNAGAVKTYPNVHKDYADVPLSSFNSITSTFAETSPHVGIYNVAYDIWTNGIATSGSTEIMIWVENFNQVPAGSNAATVSLGGRTYDVFKTPSNHYIAFVPSAVFTSGTVDLLEIFNWTISQGWLNSTATLGQIDFGVEIVETDGGDATFVFDDFSITSG